MEKNTSCIWSWKQKREEMQEQHNLKNCPWKNLQHPCNLLIAKNVLYNRNRFFRLLKWKTSLIFKNRSLRVSLTLLELKGFYWHQWFHVEPIKVQYVILTASGWNNYCRSNSKYWRELFLPPPPPQMDAHMGCQIESTRQEWSQLAMKSDRPYTVSWFIYILICLRS